MADRIQISKIRNSLHHHIGDRVKLTSKVGRKHTVIQHGVIDSTYPSIFTIKLDSNQDADKISFSYIDVLTKAVELRLCKEA